MDPAWTALISGATGAAVAGTIAKLILERTLKKMDWMETELRRLHDANLATDKRLELHVEKTDGSLRLGNQRFEHHRMTTDDLQRRMKDLEIETRATAPTRIIDTRPK